MVENREMVGNEINPILAGDNEPKLAEAQLNHKRAREKVVVSKGKQKKKSPKPDIKKFLDIEAEVSGSDSIDQDPEEPDEYDGSFIDDAEIPNEQDVHRALNAQLEEKKEKKKHIFAKGWFLTYPHCSLKKEEVYEQLKANIAKDKKKLEIKEYVVAEEKHENGEPHLHAFIKLNKRIDFSSTLWDLNENGNKKHGDYKVSKSWKASELYIKKDGNYISNIDVKAAKEHKSKLKNEDLARDPLEVLNEHLINPLQLSNLYKNHLLYNNLKQMNMPIPEDILNMTKRRHYWVYGESNSGKTTWLMKQIIGHEKEWFKIPKNNDWVGYNQQKFLYIDEFRGEVGIQQLNELCDGGSKVNVKGGSITTSWGCTLYILSNYTPDQIWQSTNSFILETIFNRFNFYELRLYQLTDINIWMQSKLDDLKAKEAAYEELKRNKKNKVNNLI